jgi:hypothetical protein
MKLEVQINWLNQRIGTWLACLLAVWFVAGCSSTKVTSRERYVYDQLPKPNRIWVYDFAATPEDVPTSSEFANPNYRPPLPLTLEEAAAGRQAGAQLAAALIEQINDLGMAARAGAKEVWPQVNDLVIRGYLLSLDPGSATMRVAIGFGAGSSDLTTAVEVFQVTPDGLRKLGRGTVQSGGGKNPGAGVGAATFLATANPVGLIVSGGMNVYGEASGKSTVEGRAQATAKEIAGVLKERFQEQGWIAK